MRFPSQITWSTGFAPGICPVGLDEEIPAGEPPAPPAGGGTATIDIPAPASLISEDGTLADDFWDRAPLPDNLRQDKTLRAITKFGTMADMLVNAQQKIGRKIVAPVDPNATPEEVQEYYKAGGLPESPDAYPQVAPPANLPEELKDDPETAAAWRQMCHEAGLNPAQYKMLTEKIQAQQIAGVNQDLAARSEALETAKASLKTEWGANYQRNLQLANTAASAFADENQREYMKNAGIFDDPVMLQVFHKIGQAVSPDRLNADSSGSIDKANLQAKIGELETSEAYLNGTHPRHTEVTKYVLQLREQLNAAG